MKLSQWGIYRCQNGDVVINFTFIHCLKIRVIWFYFIFIHLILQEDNVKTSSSIALGSDQAVLYLIDLGSIRRPVAGIVLRVCVRLWGGGVGLGGGGGREENSWPIHKSIERNTHTQHSATSPCKRLGSKIGIALRSIWKRNYVIQTRTFSLY